MSTTHTQAMSTAARQNPQMILNASGPDAPGLIDFQRGQIRRREYRPLGKLEKIMLGDGAVPHADENSELARLKRHLAVSLDWMNTGPQIGLSRDEQDILVTTGMLHPPDLPDPEWKQPPGPASIENGIPIPHLPPRIPQRLRDRMYAKTEIDGRVWLVFQPVTQILFIRHDRKGLGIVNYSADFTGRHGALVYCPELEEGHLVFGRHLIELYQ